MGTFNSHKLKAEKSNKILKHRQLRKIAKLFRYVEMCVVLFLISRVSFQHLPVALKISSEYLSGFMVISPRFVFLIGNVIIIALFAQSGKFSGNTAPEPDFYLEFLQNSTVNHQQIQDYQENVRIRAENGVKGHRRIDGSMIKNPQKQSMIKYPKKQSMNGNIIKYQEKQSMIKNPEKQSITKTTTTGLEIVEVKDHQIQDDKKKSHHKIDGSMIQIQEKQSTGLEIVEVKDYRRCQSEITRRVQDGEKHQRALQRCETENRRRSGEGETERVGKSLYPEDGMNNDEFRRTVEAFIARQQRIREQELQASST